MVPNVSSNFKLHGIKIKDLYRLKQFLGKVTYYIY